MSLLSYLARMITVPFIKGRDYLKNKKRWHGIVRFDKSVRISVDSFFEGNNSILANTSFSGAMGYGSYIGEDCHIEAEVGRFCSLGNKIWITRGTHPFKGPFVSTSPVFYSPRLQTMRTFSLEERFQEILSRTVIGNDCWIGVNVFIAGGLTIGDGAVILSGASVVSDVPPYAIVGGVPAKVIGYRFDADTIRWLLDVKWWEKPVEWLQENSVALCDISVLRHLLYED